MHASLWDGALAGVGAWGTDEILRISVGTSICCGLQFGEPYDSLYRRGASRRFRGEGATLEDAREELRGAFEIWIIVGLRHGERFEAIDSIDLNPRPAMPKPIKRRELIRRLRLEGMGAPEPAFLRFLRQFRRCTQRDQPLLQANPARHRPPHRPRNPRRTNRAQTGVTWIPAAISRSVSIFHFGVASDRIETFASAFLSHRRRTCQMSGGHWRAKVRPASPPSARLSFS